MTRLGLGAGDLAALEDLALALARVSEPRAAAQELLRFAVVPGCPGAVVAGPERTLSLLATTGHVPGTAVGRPATSPALAQALDSGRTVSTGRPDPAVDAWLAALLPDAEHVLVVPLEADGRASGALLLEHPARPLSALERAAEHASLALRRTWLLDQVRRMAATDGLTKIANRRTFQVTLEREVARSLRSGEPVSLVLLDLDHFKRLNDSLGHPAGDEVLRNVAFALTCECRDFDTPARYGGEEFAVVLPGCGAQEAGEIAERLRRAVAAAPSAAPVTASAGVATYPQHGGDAESLVQAADVALYRSKDSGRDRTTTSDGSARTAPVPMDDGR